MEFVTGDHIIHQDGEHGTIIKIISNTTWVDVVVHFEHCPHGVFPFICNGQHRFAFWVDGQSTTQYLHKVKD